MATHFKNTFGLKGKRTAQTGKDTQLKLCKINCSFQTESKILF